jgi:hypothetical protein
VQQGSRFYLKDDNTVMRGNGKVESMRYFVDDKRFVALAFRVMAVAWALISPV